MEKIKTFTETVIKTLECYYADDFIIRLSLFFVFDII